MIIFIFGYSGAVIIGLIVLEALLCMICTDGESKILNFIISIINTIVCVGILVEAVIILFIGIFILIFYIF